MARQFPDKLSSEDAVCLNGFAKHHCGHAHEKNALATLLMLCNQYGYGRIYQMMQGIEDLWRHPEKTEEYEKRYKERLELLSETGIEGGGQPGGS